MKLFFESTLENGSAYMLRNDGKLFNCEDVGLHPYIIYYLNYSLKDSLDLLFRQNLDHFGWFYVHTKSDFVRNSLRQLGIEYYCSGLFENLSQGKLNQLKSIVGDFSEGDSIHLTLDEIDDLLKHCNNETNQEFCRMRTSSLKFGIANNGIYFRISSVGFNWFNLIWEVVYRFKDRVSDVTVCTDTQSKGGKLKYYSHNGKELNRVPVDEFINLSGNPVVESYDSYSSQMLANGKSLEESFEDVHPRRINKIVDMMWNEEIKYSTV